MELFYDFSQPDAANLTLLILDRESGQPAAQARGVTFLRAEANAAVYAVGSGTYRFESALPAIVKSDTKRESQ